MHCQITVVRAHGDQFSLKSLNVRSGQMTDRLFKPYNGCWTEQLLKSNPCSSAVEISLSAVQESVHSQLIRSQLLERHFVGFLHFH